MSWIIEDGEFRDPHFQKHRAKVADGVYRGWSFRRNRVSTEVQKRIWGTVSVQPVKKFPKALQVYLAELKKLYHPEWVQFAWFHIAGSEEFDLLASQRAFDSIRFIPRFLVHPVVRRELPGIAENAKFSRSIVFERFSSLLLDGVLAELLLNTCPTLTYAGSPADAKRFGAKTCRSLFGERYWDVDFYHSAQAWSSWFCRIVFDHTIIIIDYRKQLVGVLCTTESD